MFQMAAMLIGCLSYRQSVMLAESIAKALFYYAPRKLIRYQVCRENLKIAFGEELTDQRADEIILGMWKHLLRLLVEMLQLPRKLRLENFRECITFRDRQQGVEAFVRERPRIVLSGHYGNWELSLVCFGLFGFRVGAVARALDNPYLQKWFLDFREQSGHFIILKDGATEEIAAEMEANGAIAMLGDQDAGPRGLFVDFFGKPASTFKSIGLLAMQYDALICIAYARRLEDDFVNARWARYELGTEEVIDPRSPELAGNVTAIAERYTQALERIVLGNPEQYFWVHRRWKSSPQQRSRKKRSPSETAANQVATD